MDRQAREFSLPQYDTNMYLIFELWWLDNRLWRKEKMGKLSCNCIRDRQGMRFASKRAPSRRSQSHGSPVCAGREPKSVCVLGPVGRRNAMSVATILKGARTTVKMIRPDVTVLAFAKELEKERIGAMIVSADGNSLDGIISERDLAHGLAIHGERLPRLPVSELMTKAVIVCAPEDSIAEIMNVMTLQRIRHLPVKQGDQLVGIISIGDVLKYRLGEMQLEANVLRDVAIARR
jgi:CBS domain-containing protein